MDKNSSINIGSRRELFVDKYLIEEISGPGDLRLHQPTPREIVLRTDQPWEGSQSTYFSVFRDGDKYRMYYTAHDVDLEQSTGDGSGMAVPHIMCDCMAESQDGMRWFRPDLNVFAFDGSRANNIVWQGAGGSEHQHGVHGFSPFRDPNPACSQDAAYKAVGADRRAAKGTGLYAMQSPDGVHWSLMQDEPILRQKTDGNFDSHNLAFWDAINGAYRIYVRKGGPNGRDIATATSPDFVNWTATQLLEYPGAPGEQLYTNQVLPYYRAPHLFLGFPARYIQREWSPSIEALPEPEHRRLRARVKQRFGTALTDGLFMSSRDGQTFQRWGEAFIPPGPQLEGNWGYGDNYPAWGMLETPSSVEGAPPELSMFAREGCWRGKSMCLRRYTLRIDGFVSLRAPLKGAEVLTKPLIFDGGKLTMNMATSAAGSIKVALQDENGNPLEGYSLADCDEVIGDELERTITWRGESDVASLADRPVRLRITLSDADIYAFRFV